MNNTVKLSEAQSGRMLKRRRWHKSPTASANTQNALVLLLKTVKAQRTELADLKKRLTHLEASQKVKQNTYRVPQSLAELKPRQQPPTGMTPMQAIMGKLEVEETVEELLAQLKAMG